MGVFTFLLFLFAFCSAKTLAQLNHANITLGSSLTPRGNSTWLSPSGLFAYGFYQHGNGYAVGIFIAGIPEKTVVWTKRDNSIFSSNASLALTRDGRILLQQAQVEDINIYPGLGSISLASMLDSGNFVLYNADGRIIWQSFDNPTDTLLPGQRLEANQELVSSASEADNSKGIFRIKMQSDGNLVQYPVDTPDTAPYAYYASGTNGSGNNVTLELEDDGHLFLINSSTTILRNISEGGHRRDGTVYLLKIDVDGIVRLYSFSLSHGNQKMKILWQSTNYKCAPLGLCGFNSYCTMMDNEMECRCLPGFDFVNPGNWSSGCERNFTADSCKTTTAIVAYNMTTLEGILWENNPFSVLQTDTKEDCQSACLADCNCEVAFFKDSKCGKQRPPLRFGRRTSDSNIAFIKVGILPSEGNPNYLPKVVKKEKRHLDVLIIGISLAVFGVFIFAIAGIYVRINRGRAYNVLPQDKKVEFLEDVAPRAFTFEELKDATSDFTLELGRGAFGTVYKGILPNLEKAVAVKKLERLSTEGDKGFENEIRVIGKTHHRNLVRFLGYCLNGTKRLLVYEYMRNGSLADTLFNKENHLSWDERISIARDVARGILYLHQECETQIIHCDIKPQNILIDDDGCAKISDFGLSKLLDQDQTRTYTTLRGTKGYVAPEWHQKSAVTVKADVYSFGIVLLEIICCRKSVDFSLSDDEAILEELASDCFHNGELHRLVPSEEEVDMRKLERTIKIALWCIQHDPSYRPGMNKVLMMLQGAVDIPIPPRPDSFLSTI